VKLRAFFVFNVFSTSVLRKGVYFPFEDAERARVSTFLSPHPPFVLFLSLFLALTPSKLLSRFRILTAASFFSLHFLFRRCKALPPVLCFFPPQGLSTGAIFHRVKSERLFLMMYFLAPGWFFFLTLFRQLWAPVAAGLLSNLAKVYTRFFLRSFLFLILFSAFPCPLFLFFFFW